MNEPHGQGQGMMTGWALVLGASSGFGEATAIELARAGLDVFGVHLDRRATLPNVERIAGEIRALGRQADFFNVNAADDGKRKEVLDAIAARTGGAQQIRVLLHSLAFGTLRPFVGADAVTRQQLDMTCDVMAHSLVYWVQDLVARKLLLSPGGRVYAMTSSGGHRVWGAYGPVSAAKAALESNVRQLALELAPLGITANSIRAGITDTPALRKIPGHEEMLDKGRQFNPHKRLTEPRDVACAIAVLARPETHWLTGNVLGVDGGEDIVG